MNGEKMDEAQKKAMLLLDGVGDGFTSTQLFIEKKNCHAYTFDDVIIMPGYIDFDASDVNLGSNISRNISVNVPLLSSPMDTVTEHRMAIGMALQGAIGVVHYNMTIEEQANEVRLVKKYKNGFITNPVCLSPENSISDVDAMKAQLGMGGYPITEDGKMGSKLIGIVTNRDTDYIADRSILLKDVMVTDLVTAPEGVSLMEANEILRKSRKGKLPVVNTSGEIVALISRTDLKKSRNFPMASMDKNDQLLCGAAIGTRPNDKDRCAALVDAGVDVIIIDSSQVCI
jgi:IMP dehydrogenase